MVAASEIMGLMRVEGMEYEVRVVNTFLHVGARSIERRKSAPAVLNCDIAVAQDTDDGKIYSLDDYLGDFSDGEVCDSSLHDRLDACSTYQNAPSDLNDIFAPGEMHDEAVGTSTESSNQERDWSSKAVASNAASALDDCAHSVKQSCASDGTNSSVDGRPRMAQAVASNSRGPRGSATSKTITKMFIGNLPRSMSTDRMKAELCKRGFFGTFTSVNLPQADGIGRGFGFVRFCNAEEAQRFASVFRGCEFEGRHCYVNPAARQSNPSIP
eukprot:TRINITY_DN17493_c0_g4_i1.p1 TRINITY_DN17493_c0_g4~~TRINITY_DN17493_c0_g4_i1.p1  ORF type:complete len:270 (+),score=42.95 TRINITY_DN17493_c0_g4_i1:84-893(+)